MNSSGQKQRFLSVLIAAAAIFCGLLSSLSGFIYFTLYWPYRHLFNEQGRYFDEEQQVVYHSDSGILIVPTLFFMLLTLLLVWCWWRRKSG